MNAKHTILIIDDEKAEREIYKSWLNTSGENFSIIEAMDGIAGYKAYVEHQPSCIILDFLMSGEGGFQCLLRIKETYSELPPIIFLTGYHTPQIAEDALALGAYSYIDKNELNAERLNDAVRKILNPS